jgi:hypothetical protein
MSHLFTISWLLLALAGLISAGNGSVPVTPHDSYSSSVGVLGCKINTNRVAYWPDSVDCTNICVSLSYAGRTVHLLRIDQSGGAHDVSYDAWNYLYTGKSATDAPTAGGAIQMDYEDVDASNCKDLINTKGKKLPLSAANSMNFLVSCLEDEGSWVGSNYVLYNIATPICTYGVDEVCTLDYPAQNQASCPSGIGNTQALTSDPVVDIRYPTGEKVVAGSDQAATGATSKAVGKDVGWGLMGVMVVAGWVLVA